MSMFSDNIYIESWCSMKLKYADKYRKIGLKVSYYRKAAGITQEQLAEKINKATSYVGALEAPNVDKALSFDAFFDIAEALDVEPYKLLKDDE